MKVNRSLQYELLTYLADLHPYGIRLDDRDIRSQFGRHGEQALHSTAIYLEEHGLVRSGLKRFGNLPGEGYEAMEPCEITARGIDFISDDGGLGAILNMITVKLDAEQWRELLAAKVEQLPIRPEEKGELAKTIRGLPAKALERVFEKLLDWSVDHAHDALPALRAVLAAVT